MALSGCGSDPVEGSSEPLESGTVISAKQYLADSAAAADSVAAFMGAVESLGTEPTPAEMRAAAPTLSAPLETTAEFAARLGAARLDDVRLDEQRRNVAASLGELVEAMRQLTGFVEQGDRLRAAALTTRVAGRADALRRSADNA